MAGVRRAAQRKLEHELGIPTSQVSLQDLQYLTRIHYLAPSDGMWGEHESESRALRCLTYALTQYLAVDYILFLTAPVTLDVNVNEVCDVKWVSPEELRALMEELDRESSP